MAQEWRTIPTMNYLDIKYSNGITRRKYPDGTMQKLLDVSAVTGLGWKARIGLKEGIAATYEWYLENGA